MLFFKKKQKQKRQEHGFKSPFPVFDFLVFKFKNAINRTVLQDLLKKLVHRSTEVN